MKLNLKRDSAYADGVRDYKVILDNQVIGNISDGQTQQFDISEGAHTLYLKLDWARSNKISFNANSSEELNFTCVSSLKGSAVLLAIVYATFLFWKYIKLERV